MNASSPPEQPGGPVLGPYVVERAVARGAFGTVYLVRHARLGVTHALKVVLAERMNERALVRFRREVEVTARLGRHPNIVAIHACGVTPEGQPYYSMDYVGEGRTLEHLVLEEGPLEPARAARYMAQVCGALDFAHSEGVVHRDLKPGNILLDSFDRPILVDFGLAKPLDAAARLTLTGTMVGTPSYMAPEQATGKNDEVDARSDVFAAGAVLYFLLSGRPPFEGSSLADLVRQILDADPRPLGPEIPGWLGHVVRKAMARAKRDRYTSAAEMGRVLERATGEGSRGLRPHLPVIVAASVALLLLVLSLSWLWGRSPGAPALDEQAKSLPPRGAGTEQAGKPPDAESLFAEGVALEEKGDFEAALRSFVAATLRDDRHLGAWLRIGNAHVRRNELDEALRAYEKALSIDPGSPRALNNIANVLLQKGDAEGALRRYDQVIAAHPDFAEALQNRGELHINLLNPRAAIEDLERALAIEPSNADALAIRAVAWLQLGRFDRALEDAEKAFAIAPANAHVVHRRGTIRHLLGDLEQAMVDYRNALALEPGRAEVWASLGRLESDLGDFAGMLDAYTRAVDLDPRNADYRISKGWALQAEGEHDRAADEFDRVITLSRSDAARSVAYNNRSVARVYTGDLEGALEDADQATSLDSSYALAFINRGMIQALLGRREASILDFDEAARIDADDPTPHLFVAGLGGSLKPLKAYLGGTRFAARIARCFVGDIPPGDLLAEARAIEGDAARAEAVGQAQGFLGLLAEAQGRPGDARTHYAACLETRCISFSIYFWAAARLREMGR